MGFISFFLRKYFMEKPPILIDSHEAAAYERLLAQTNPEAGAIEYDCPYPKYRFIAYMTEHKAMLVHGSNHTAIDRFETRRQTLYNGKYVEAVFATSDAIWPIFYAVFNRSKLHGNFRNGCIRVKKNVNRFYFFSLTEATMNNSPWTSGTVYFLPKESFARSSSGFVYFDEWISRETVAPRYKLAVSAEDFPFIEEVSSHRSEESIMKTWLLYKRRIREKLASRQD
ncbi:hypothetical protein [Paenibacillus sp. FJAT-27812]|uniref:hypothetical protein n=1 Tax=Paenibacillus sp. FJAT-27812 TaxID=1684143 RepID=UPI0007C6780F|nr:hypothetical protein [Paenibacillus sp. FJAT-27812]